jgi:aspartate carbamoyltransferase catalytic subunit
MMSTEAKTWTRKDLLGIAPLEKYEIEMLLNQAASFKEVSTRAIKKVPALRGKTVINFFYEASTRTRMSFEVAAKRLSADTYSIAKSGSSLSKGETLIDTVLNLEAMNPDIIILRHSASGAPHLIAKHTKAGVVNAGDGAHEHPSQALLDAFTMREKKGTLEGLRVSIIGDISHSRVALSNIYLLNKMGAKVTVCGPASYLPVEIESLGVRKSMKIDEAIEGADVIMMLRIQLERQGGKSLPSLREYYQLYGLTPERMSKAKPDALVMHPGPLNRGVEIDSAVADGPRSVILEQVTNGVAVRMAILYLLLGGSKDEDAH